MTAGGATPVTSDLGSRFHRGLSISLLNTLVSRLGVFLLGIALARLLAPDEFGVYAAALVVQSLFQAANEVGSGAAVVRRQGDVRPLLSTAWTMSIAWSVLGFTVVMLAAPLMAEGLGSPQATGLIRFMAINVLVEGFASVPAALLTRNLQQARRMLADVIGMVVNLATTAGLALAGAGAWSLAVGNVAGTFVVVVMLIALTRAVPTFGWRREHAGEVLSSGFTMTGSYVLLVALQMSPQTITGSVLGPTALGFFYLAFNIANWPASIATMTLERIALATFSRVREVGGDVSEAAATIVALIGGAVLTGGVALALLAGEVVTVLYGPVWLPAVAVLSGLAVASVAKALAELVFSVLVANGSGASATVPQLAWLLVLVPASVAGAHFGGLPGIGWSQAAVALLFAVPMHLWFLRRRGAVRLGPLLHTSRTPLLVTAVNAALLVAVQRLSPWPVMTVGVGGTLTLGAIVLIYVLMRARTAAAMAGGSTTPERVRIAEVTGDRPMRSPPGGNGGRVVSDSSVGMREDVAGRIERTGPALPENGVP